jgi:hypothetical protein
MHERSGVPVREGKKDAAPGLGFNRARKDKP